MTGTAESTASNHAATPLKELGDDPNSEKPITLKDGRFGPYVTDGETSASLRVNDSVETITHERAIELLAVRRTKGPAPKRSWEAASPSIARFCAACGRSYTSPVDDCPVSHDTTPASEDTTIGQIVTYRRALRRRTAVVVGGTISAPLVLEVTGGGEREPVRFDEVEGTEAWMTVASPLYRLGALSRVSAWSDVLTPWLVDNRDKLLATIGDRRAFAIAAVGAGDVPLAKTSGLSTFEISWLTMHAQRDSGDMRGAFRAALDLDSERYPDHSLVLLEAVAAHNELLDESMLREHVGKLSREFAGQATLSAALDGVGPEGTDAVVADLNQLGATRTASDVRSVAAGTDSVATNALSRAATEASLDPVEAESVHVEFPSIADDLIDAGRVDASSTADVASPYVRARINVEDVTDEELRSFGATRELARRAYVANDRKALDGLGEESYAAASYYLALDALRSGEVPGHVPDDDTLKAVAASIRSGKAHPNALADPSAWPVLDQLITEEDAESHPELASIWQLERALEDLAAWEFESALIRARTALKWSGDEARFARRVRWRRLRAHSSPRWSGDEAIRDEALNIVGFVLYQQGNDEPAIKALEKALEGEYSANLQANIGIIAEELQPEVAAHHVGRLAIEAPTIDLQLAAVRHAFGIWTTSADAWDEDGLVMPDDLRSVFRKLAVADVPYDDYVTIVQLLARADDEWLARGTNTSSGPHVGSAARLVYRTKASHDPGEYVEALAKTSKAGNNEEWFTAEKDGFVESLRSLIFSEDGAIGPASYAFAAIDAGLELDDFDYVTLSSGAAMSILGAIANDEGLPSDSITAMIDTARSRLKRLDEDQREHLSALVTGVGNQYGAVHADFYIAVHNHILQGIRTVGGQLYGIPRRNIRWSVVVDAVQPMKRQANESAQDMARALAYVKDDDLREHMTELIQRLKGLASKLENPRRMF